MKKFILELRRREVFRSAGLYVGICWILVEGASIVLPTFGAPDWILRALIIAALVGFPVALVLSWIYDVTDQGVVVQPDATDTVIIPFGDRKGDFIVIGVLSVALIFSVYLNVTGGPDVVETIEPISVLIADFDNQTGDPLFDGSMEQTMSFALEGASFITTYNRLAAAKQVEKVRPGGGPLNEEAARLVAVREGIKLVLSGTVSEDSGRYEFVVHAVEPESGERIIEVKKRAADKAGVLGVISEIAGAVREELGDTSFKEESLRGTETFTAASLEAAKIYTEAQNLAYSGDYAAASDSYRKALDIDPNFGRAYSGWALAAFNLGRNAEAEELWQKALTFMDSMTDRERFRTLGLYYMAVSRNYPKAIESYSALVEKYPADGAGHNNLAVAYFATLNFERALAEGQSVLEIYPKNLFYQQNFALYAMYAGKFDAAEELAKKVIETDDGRYYAWLPVAIANLSRDDIEAAQSSYQSMAATGDPGASLAKLGLADIELYRGKYLRAAETLQQGIAADIAADNTRATATKNIALAEAFAGLDDTDASMQAIEEAMSVSGGLARQVPAALLYLKHGRVDKARSIAVELSQQVQTQRRAYGAMILGIIDSQAGKHIEALDKFSTAINLADFWLIRFYLGQVYLAAGSDVEALDEFEICMTRRGEASALFLDDLPTWRYVAPLYYWRGRAQRELGMEEAAKESLETFIRLRADGDPLAAYERQQIISPPD